MNGEQFRGFFPGKMTSIAVEFIPDYGLSNFGHSYLPVHTLILYFVLFFNERGKEHHPVLVEINSEKTPGEKPEICLREGGFSRAPCVQQMRMCA